MSLQQLDTTTLRDAAFRLRTSQTTLATVLQDLDEAVRLAAIDTEAAPTKTLVIELDEEINLLQQLLDTKAAAMELADAGFSTGGSWLMTELRRLSGELETSLDDDIGFHGSGDDARTYYQDQALDRAGIDLSEWDPALGVDHNRAIIERVYEYYAQLHLEHRELLWPGVGALAGATFYAGFSDLDMMADLFATSDRDGVTLRDLIDQIKKLPFDVPVPEMESIEATLELAPNQIEAEIRWFESAFLVMQQKIFLDMSSSHEAYLDGGMLAIEKLYEDDPYNRPQQAIEAWRLTDDGIRNNDRGLLERGATELALREQRHIIQRDYDEIERDSADPDRTSRPDNNRDTGSTRVDG